MVSSSSTIAHIYVLERITKRVTKESQVYFFGKGIVKDNSKSLSEHGTVKSVVSSDERTGALLCQAEQNSHIMVTYAINGPETVKTTDKSQVFLKSAAFSVCQDAVDNFRTAPTVSIPDIYSSPPKRRVSVCGKLQHIGDLQSDSHYKRRRLVIVDDFNRQIDVKLWGQQADSITVHEDDQVKCQTLEVDHYTTASSRKFTSLNSTPSTRLIPYKDDQPARQEHVTVIAINESQLVTEDGTIYEHQLSVEDKRMLLPAMCMVTVTRNMITQIQVQLDPPAPPPSLKKSLPTPPPPPSLKKSLPTPPPPPPNKTKSLPNL